MLHLNKYNHSLLQDIMYLFYIQVFCKISMKKYLLIAVLLAVLSIGILFYRFYMIHSLTVISLKKVNKEQIKAVSSLIKFK